MKCPKCHCRFEPRLRCLRCSHEWMQRGASEPKVCPNPVCKSPYWNKERRRTTHQ